VSPLKALAVDVEKNLRAPLAGIGLAAERLGTELHAPSVAIRTGDTPANGRRAIQRRPPDILITTPESLCLMLTSSTSEILRSVRSVIVDEIHAGAGTKRGAHLELSLERLEAIARTPPQRIGLSATQRPLDEIARFLGGQTEDGARPVTVVDAGHRKPMEVEVIVPVEDMAELGKPSDELRPGPAVPGPERVSIRTSIHPRLLELIRQHRSTLVFDVWVDPLVDLAKEGRLRKIEPQRIDGLPDLETPRADRLREAGFFDSYRGLVLRG